MDNFDRRLGVIEAANAKNMRAVRVIQSARQTIFT